MKDGLSSILQNELNKFLVKNRYLQSTSQWQKTVSNAIENRQLHMIRRAKFVIAHKPTTSFKVFHLKMFFMAVLLKYSLKVKPITFYFIRILISFIHFVKIIKNHLSSTSFLHSRYFFIKLYIHSTKTKIKINRITDSLENQISKRNCNFTCVVVVYCLNLPFEHLTICYLGFDFELILIDAFIYLSDEFESISFLEP